MNENKNPMENQEEKNDLADQREEAMQAATTEPEKGGVLKSSRLKHGGIATAFTVGFLVIVILINVVVSVLGDRFPSINIDLSPNSMNSLSEEAEEVVDAVQMPTTITILLSEDTARSNSSYSQVVSLSEKMQERNQNITVKFQDLDADPTFAAKYQNDSLAAGGVIVETEKRHRVLAYSDLFKTEMDYQTYSQKSYSYVDSALASAVSQANADVLPIIAFATGHSEGLDATALKRVLSNNNFEIVDFNIMTEEIPENAQMIVIGTPTTDYTQAEIEKLDAYLDENINTNEISRSLLLTFDPSQVTGVALPNLNIFLQEWGMIVQPAMVVETDASHLFMQDQSAITVKQSDELDMGADTQYNMLAAWRSSPIEPAFKVQTSVVTYSLLQSYDTSYLIEADTTEDSTPEKAEQNVAMVGQKYIKINDKNLKSNVFVFGSSQVFNSSILESNTFGNGKYVIDLVKYATDTTDSDMGVIMKPVQTNVMDISMSAQVANVLGIGVFTLLPLIGLLIAGIVVYLKRRHL